MTISKPLRLDRDITSIDGKLVLSEVMGAIQDTAEEIDSIRSALQRAITAIDSETATLTHLSRMVTKAWRDGMIESIDGKAL